MGDFNCVRTSRDWLACSNLNQDHIHFNHWIEDSNLQEVHISIVKFTCIGPGLKKSRLDRAFINIEWASKGAWKLIATARKNSDHRRILLVENNLNWGPKPFRVFNVWLKEESLKILIENNCRSLKSQSNVQDSIRRIKSTRNGIMELMGISIRK